MMNHIVYLAFGNSGYYDETLFSLLSYYTLHKAGQNKLILYTDNPEYFLGFVPAEIAIVPLPAEKVEEWKGRENYPYRIKVKVLQDAAERFQGNILYVDTDTIFLKNIASMFEELAGGAFVMDACEGPLSKNKGGIARKVKRLLARQNIFSHSDLPAKVTLSEHFEIWNSGTIGFNTQMVDNRLRSAEILMDTLYKAYPLYTMEQIAITYYLSQQQLKESKAYIHHYWYFKEFREPLRQFFAFHEGKTFEELVSITAKPDPWEMSASKRKYKTMAFWQKQWQKIRYGKKWVTPRYDPN